MEAVRLKSSVDLRMKARRHEAMAIPGIVDIGAKPKKAWFDFWLTLFILFCQLVLISVAMCATLVTFTPHV
jgi:hypothetical protein